MKYPIARGVSFLLVRRQAREPSNPRGDPRSRPSEWFSSVAKLVGEVASLTITICTARSCSGASVTPICIDSTVTTCFFTLWINNSSFDSLSSMYDPRLISAEHLTPIALASSGCRIAPSESFLIAALVDDQITFRGVRDPLKDTKYRSVSECDAPGCAVTDPYFRTEPPAGGFTSSPSQTSWQIMTAVRTTHDRTSLELAMPCLI